jgi:hypothetical protein
MSRAKTVIVFLASVVVGSAAVAVTASPVQATGMSICPCTECVVQGGELQCIFMEHRQCFIGVNGVCGSSSCPAAQKCFGQ